MPDTTLSTGTNAALAQSVLALPVTALPGVDSAAEDALSGIGVRSVYDLARSAVFATAASLSASGGGGPAGAPPADWVEDAHPEDPDPANWPVETLRAVTKAVGKRLQKSLKAETIGDLAAWPPYPLARNLLDLAVGVAAVTEGPAADQSFDETVPADLIPGNTLPTESVRYTTLVLGEVHEPPGAAPAAATPILSATQLDLGTALTKAGAGFQYAAEGALLTYEQAWYHQGLALGDVRKTVPLAAGEVVRVAQRDWTRRQTGSHTEAGTEAEQLANDTTHNRAMNEVADAVASEAQNGFTKSSSNSFSQQAGASYSSGLLGGLTGGPTFSAGEASNTTNAMTVTGSQGRRQMNSAMQQNINEATQQHASAARNRRATVVEEISESDAATASTRILANYNHAHALNVVFYELVQVCRVETRLRKVDKVLFVPLKLLDFAGAELTPNEATALIPHAANSDIRELLLRYVKGPVAQFPTLPRGPEPDPAPVRPSSTTTTPAAQPGPLVQPLAEQVRRMRFVHGGLVDGLNRADIAAQRLPLAEAPHLTTMELAGVDAGAQVIATLADGSQEFAEVTASGEARFGKELDPATIRSLTLNSRNVPVRPNATLTLPVLGTGPTAALTLPIPEGTLTTVMEVKGALNDLEQQRLVLHLQRNRVRYNQALWAELDETAIAMLLAGYTYGEGADARPLLQWVDPKPVGFVGNYLVFRMPLDAEVTAEGASATTVAQKWGAWRAEHGLGEDQLTPEKGESILVSMPADGLFAEAVLGRANCAEKIDISRFINWHEAPIPILPPEIAAVSTAGQPQGMDLEPGQFPTPLVNIVGPTSLPAPTLGAATVNAVGNGAMFRDMSAAVATLGLAQGALQASQAGAQSASEQATELQAKQMEMAGKVAELAAQAVAAYFTGGASLAATGLTAAGGLMNAGKKVDSGKAAKSGTTTGAAPAPGSTGSGGGSLPGPLGGDAGAPATGGANGLVLPPAYGGGTQAAVDAIGYEERGLLSALGQNPAPPAAGSTAPVRLASYDGTGGGATGGLPGAVYEPIDVKLRLFIPAPLVAFPQGGGPLDLFTPEALYALLAGDNRTFHPTQGTHRVQATFRLSPDPTRNTPFIGAPEVSWGETRAYAPSDGRPVDKRPGWWWELKQPDTQPYFRKTHDADDAALRISAQLIPDQAQWRVRFDIHAGIPLEGFKGTLAPIIDAQITLDVRTRPQADGGASRTEVWLWGLHDGFPAYEMYVNDRMLYGYLPDGHYGTGPWNLFPPMDVTVNTPSSALSTTGGFRPVHDLATVQI
ncbi:hypothetical protein [Streptomyces sp. NPDC056660]|uniref:hypothetical protein n=1 Tax=Streptomyces sp. NPDC056660 TaxID=3345897 RepID=UPI0036C1F290